jgi:hypothetical protein
MYHLTLTNAERKALDWVGGRYAHGHDLYRLLWVHCEPEGNEHDWDSDAEITFDIPEDVAWQIMAIAEECEHRWDCFAPELVEKLETLCNQVV